MCYACYDRIKALLHRYQKNARFHTQPLLEDLLENRFSTHYINHVILDECLLIINIIYREVEQRFGGEEYNSRVIRKRKLTMNEVDILLIYIILIGVVSLATQPLQYHGTTTYVYPWWSEVLGWIISLSSMFMIPLWMKLLLSITPYDERQTVIDTCQSSRSGYRHWLSI
ncbi:hypothetical protein Anas_04170 [Armadillidium nasatum]|uniref:Uncharacterized protein n=1 Tax=Armadillidium nasatum TaxID=96803 RepID=A0A5N5SWQ6_9CRUS|nr:hypothetical protein Anas_04170 [Armadillidium nasatum]